MGSSTASRRFGAYVVFFFSLIVTATSFSKHTQVKNLTLPHHPTTHTIRDHSRSVPSAVVSSEKKSQSFVVSKQMQKSPKRALRMVVGFHSRYLDGKDASRGFFFKKNAFPPSWMILPVKDNVLPTVSSSNGTVSDATSHSVDTPSGSESSSPSFGDVHGSYLGPPDDIFVELRNKESHKLERTLFMVVVDAGSTKTNANLWSTTVITEANQLPSVNWTRMKILANLGTGSNLRSFYTRLLAANSTPAMIERTAALLAPIFANGRREIRKRVREAKDPALVLSDIPVVVHSTAGLRDMDVTLRQDLFRAINFVINGSLESDSLFEEMMIATNKAEALCPRPRILTPLRTRFKVNVTRDAFLETKVMRFFTNPRYCRAITGIEEAVFTFITANIATGVIQSMRTDASQKHRLGGILEVGGASMQVVFPVENRIHNGPLGTLDLTKHNRFLRQDLFPTMGEEFNVFGTSYMNLGINRALALLLKQYCQRRRSAGGRCKSPCFQRGWRQTCVPGTPRSKKGSLVQPSEGQSPFQLDSEGRVLMEGNNLLDVANYCRKNNPLLRNFTPRSDCRRAGFFLNFTDVESRAQIHNCVEIEGTGDMEACYKSISSLLFGTELPGNQETLSETGAAAPAEIGQFMAPQGVMYVVGNSLVFPIYQLKEWRMLRTAYYQISPNETRRCDFTHLKDAARLLCSLELDASHSFLNPITQKLITLNTHTYDYCYKSVYALALLDSINVQKGDVQVQFEAKIKHVESGQVLDFGWTYGAITNLILDPRFVSDLFALGPKFYRSPYGPTELVAYEKATKQTAFSERASL